MGARALASASSAQAQVPDGRRLLQDHGDVGKHTHFPLTYCRKMKIYICHDVLKIDEAFASLPGGPRPLGGKCCNIDLTVEFIRVP